MGARFAPNYSNVFMGAWEGTFVYSDLNIYLNNIIWWGRYIDDIILLW